MKNKLYLGVDPGRSKTGLALVDAEGKIIRQQIAATATIATAIENFIQNQNPVLIVLGNGTNNASLAAALDQVVPQLPRELIDEAHSTEEARALYWQCNPPQGWRRLIPLGLLVPPVPLDDYAAIILVRRFLEEHK